MTTDECIDHQAEMKLKRMAFLKFWQTHAIMLFISGATNEQIAQEQIKAWEKWKTK